MILSGKEIKKRLGTDIHISDFKEENLNPNSYNVTLNNKLVIYSDGVLDMKEDNPYEELIIPEDGLLLMPGQLYLGRTNEFTKTYNLVPMIEGRSSIGRLGVFIHITAGFGDQGFEGYWTLEISCIKPVVIYPDIEIGQLFFHTIEGELTSYDSGKYQRNDGIQTSKMFKDFEKGDNEC